ncbi:MAG TPA: hypothetical protein VFZ53_13200, partial [Polyangiaceae bacterium]
QAPARATAAKPASAQAAKTAAATPANPPKIAWAAGLVERAKKNGIKTFDCPTSLKLEPAGNFGTATLAFRAASATSTACPASSDLAPANDRGSFCLVCSFDAAIQLKRSGPKNHTCWVKPDDSNSFACEYVPPTPPPPVTETCNFQLRPANVDLHPFDHTDGDKDMNTDGGFMGSDASWVDLEVDASLGREGNDLVLTVSGKMKESESDWTTYKKSKKFVIGDRSGEILNGTKADINACFAAYGTQRPFTAKSGSLNILTGGNGFQDYPATWMSGTLRFSSTCRVDQDGSSDVLGCNKLSFEQLSVLIK